MGKKEILMMINSALIIALFCNLSLVSASDLAWNAGDVIVWGRYTEVSTIVTNVAAGTTLEDKDQDGYDFQYNLTSYDLLSKQYEYIYSSPSGTNSPTTRSFDWENMANNYLTSDNGDFINVNYQWDYATNQTVLTTFSFYLNTNFLNNWRLIEPNWVNLNTAFKGIFNETYVLDTLADPYEPLIHNFTWGTFLDSIDFKIMGRSNLNYALNQFKDSTSKWTFEFDLSGVYSHDLNGDWEGYESYVVVVEVEYSDGGVLEKYVRDTSYTRTTDDIQTDYLSHTKEAIGGLKKAMASIPIITAIIGLLTISTFILIKKRKK
ncbi:MAG: hypothetical protein ACTSXA_09400 [Candidatus Heimdallarchaeota archaeon]